jgi:hypothetical protein
MVASSCLVMKYSFFVRKGYKWFEIFMGYSFYWIPNLSLCKNDLFYAQQQLFLDATFLLCDGSHRTNLCRSRISF